MFGWDCKECLKTFFFRSQCFKGIKECKYYYYFNSYGVFVALAIGFDLQGDNTRLSK